MERSSPVSGGISPGIEMVEGDITRQRVDAIVNAANRSLLGGGGVDGAIHRAAGPGLLDACRQLHGCETGEAKMTPAFALPATWVIHTVGPVWQGGTQGEDALLARCYQSVLAIGAEYGLRTIAFPSISTGAYGFPIERAARIALREISGHLRTNQQLYRATIVCYNRMVFNAYRDTYDGLE